MLNEVNTIREQMGLPLLNENELLHLELSKINLDPMNEGVWDNVKYALSKLGRYKAGGKIFGKSQTDAKAAAQITAILDKQGNEIIKSLDKAIKEKNPEFPNNKGEMEYLNTILEIATVYDSIVAATKIAPGKEGHLPVDAANAIIEDLRAYTQKYLDVDLTAAFSVFNEEEEGVEEMIDEASSPAQQAAIAISKKENGVKEGEIDEAAYDVGRSIGRGIGKAVKGVKDFYNDAKAVNDKGDAVASKFAATKDAIKKGELKAYDTERMKTLKSWRLPLSLMGAGASFGALSWVIEYLFPPEKITTMTPKEVTETVKQAFGNIKPGEGMTQIMNRTLGTGLSPNSNPNDVVAALSKLGGGNPQTGVDIITQRGGIFADPVAAKATLTELVKNPTEHGSTLKQVFTGTWAGTGKAAGDTLVTVSGGTLTGLITKAVITWTTKTTIIKSTKAVIAAPILKVLGIGLLAGGVVAALSRYKGRKSSRAQVLNDLIQYLRPTEGTKENPPVIDDDGGGKEQGGGKEKQGGNDAQLYNYLKKYFQDIYNFRSQVNTDTYGKGGTSNADKVYSGSGGVPSNTQVTPKDADDLLKLMESLEPMSEETIDQIGLSSNQLKLIKTNIQRLTQLIKLINKFNSQDKNLNGLINKAQQNPVSTIDINSLLQSDAKSLKIFVSDFNKALYAVKFKNGSSIIDQLGKIQINKLDEKAERVESKSAMNAIYNKRRELLANLPGYITTLYSIFSFLIDKMKSNPEGNKKAQADYLTGQKGGKESPGLTSTDKAEMNKGLNAGNSGGAFGGFRAAGQNLEEGSVLTKAEMIAIMIEEAAVAPEEGGEQGGQEQVNQNGRHFKIMKALAAVAPTYARTIAKAYNDMYPDDQKLSTIKLGNYLTVTLNAIAFIPESRMKTYIKQAGGDMAAYISTLSRIDEANSANSDAIRQSANYKLMTSLSSVITSFKNKIAMRYNQENPMDRVSAPKLSSFLETVLMGAAMIPKNKMRQFIQDSGGDFAMYTKALANITELEPGEEIAGGNFPVDTFKPDNVEGYDLSRQKDSFRIGLSKKAAEVISRQTDTKLDEKNMLSVMKILIDTLNKKYLRPDKQIPMTGK